MPTVSVKTFVWDWRAAATVLVVSSAVLLWKAPGIENYFWNPDHGFQLSMGAAVLRGGFPFVDFVSVYGPLVALVSASALSLGHLFGETLVCVIGYAACAVLLFSIIRDRVGVVVAIVIVGCALFFVGRLHKWYIWLFPLTLLYCYHRYLATRKTQVGWWWAAGTAAGIGALFRLEFGVAFASVWAALAAFEPLINNSTFNRCVYAYLRFATPFAVIFASWLLVLALRGGTESIEIYLLSTVTGVQGVVTDWSLPPPKFHWLAPLSVDSTIHALIFWVLPGVYAVCVAYGVFHARHNTADKFNYGLFYVAVGLMGFAMYPHGWYRPDIAHLRQTLACALVALPCIGRIVWELDFALQGIARSMIRIGGVLLIVASCVWGAVLLRADSWDWAPLLSDATPRLKSLFHIESSQTNLPQGHLTVAIQRLSAPGEAVLVTPFMPQLYYLADRRMSGINPIYLRGIFDDQAWRDKNLARVRRDPPVLVVVETKDFNRSTSTLYSSQPELYDYIRNRYRSTVYQVRNWHILAAK